MPRRLPFSFAHRHFGGGALTARVFPVAVCAAGFWNAYRSAIKSPYFFDTNEAAMDARASGTICGRAAELRRAAKIYGWTANGAYADRIMTKDFFAGFGFAGAAAFPAARAEALTQAEAAPVGFEALGRETPEKFLTAVEGDMTRRDALRFAFEAMGWGFALAAVDQIGILPEWPEVEGVSYISATMSPQPPAAMTASLDEPLLPEDMEEFENWLRECAKSVSWKSSFSWNGTTLFMVKRGVGNPSGSANGDMENGRNEPLFAAALAVDMAAVPCQIATAEMIGSKRAALATIASRWKITASSAASTADISRARSRSACCAARDARTTRNSGRTARPSAGTRAAASSS